MKIKWNDLMHGVFLKGPGYWSNRHFALIDEIEVPKNIKNLKSLQEQTNETTLEELTPITFFCEFEINESWEVITKTIEPTKRTIELTSPDGRVYFDTKYINFLKWLIPGCSIKPAAKNEAAIILLNDKMVGLLMPWA